MKISKLSNILRMIKLLKRALLFMRLRSSSVSVSVVSYYKNILDNSAPHEEFFISINIEVN